MDTLVDYLDEVEESVKNNARHRVLLRYEYQASKDFQQNRRPGDFEQNLDFSENGSLKNASQVQSEYFNSIQYPILDSVWSWIDTFMWYLVEGDIKRGAGVTVNCELWFELPNTNSFRGTVVSDSYVDNGFYIVEDNVGVLYQCY